MLLLYYMKLIKKIIFFILYCSFFTCNAQNKYYKFDIYDGENYLFTMNQSNDLILNGTKLINDKIDYSNLSIGQKSIYVFSNLLFTTLLGQPITHEYGHQSVLNELGIGSICKPFIDKNFNARVTGVTDATLINLRNTDLPNYIRLHTAGLESDYAYLKKSESKYFYNNSQEKVYDFDFFMRKIGIQFYYISYMLPKGKSLKESDENELDRDIVGHDIFGMVRHLHRPNMTFYRYTEFDDLSDTEKKYVKRIGRMSLLNFLNPVIWKGQNFEINDNVNLNFSVSYSLSPFGDFTEQNIYLNINEKYKLNPYFRQYYNNETTFLAGGINLSNFQVSNEKIILNTSLDFWNQPKKLDFNSNEKVFGIGLKSSIGIQFANWNKKSETAYFNIGASYKSAGFIPESPSLNEDFRMIFGIILSINNN